MALEFVIRKWGAVSQEVRGRDPYGEVADGGVLVERPLLD